MKSTPTTQQNIPIAGIKDGILILNDGQYRLVLEISAINFALKSEQEQNSLIFQYQGFLNSIHFPIEIVVQSKKLDLAPYINKIKKLAKEQDNELLKIQTEDYADFVGQLIDIANIMKKKFFLVVGFQPLEIKAGLFDKIFSGGKKVSELRIPEEEFIHHSKELRQRATNVAQSLGSMGLHCKQLSTEELIEEFYLVYNPEVAGKERLTDANLISTSMVTGSNEEKSSDTSQVENDNTIDNRDQVKAEQKKKQNEKTLENNKNLEKKKNEADENKQKEKTKKFSEESEVYGKDLNSTQQAATNMDQKVVSDPALNKNFDN